MRWYWVKIGLTSLVIFCVGYAGIRAFRIGKREVVDVVHSNSDITIPLPFLPFRFDGTKLGSFRKVVLHRTAPGTIESVDVTVRVTDGTELANLTGCQLTVDDPTRLNENSSFRCAVADSSMVPFGTVQVQTRSEGGDWELAATVPLVLPKSVAADIRGTSKGRIDRRETDRQFRQMGDSLAVLGRMMGQATSDSVREAIRSQMDDLQNDISDLRESLKATAPDAAAGNGHGRVTVEAPLAPDPPKAAATTKSPSAKPARPPR